MEAEQFLLLLRDFALLVEIFNNDLFGIGIVSSPPLCFGRLRPRDSFPDDLVGTEGDGLIITKSGLPHEEEQGPYYPPRIRAQQSHFRLNGYSFDVFPE